MNESEVLIIGSGAAGLTCALKLAQMGIRSTVVSKTQLESGATLWAQGGISAVFDEDDSLDAHVRDTLIAGADLCDDQAVKFTVERGPGVVRWLNELGVAFTRDTGAGNPEGLHLTREGGHSHRRVVHAADATGHAVETTLAGVVLANPLITVRERLVTLDLILDAQRERVIGAYLYDRNSKRVEAVSAKCVVLATGGANQVYLYSSNPYGASGDGIAMAWRAGCRVANMEFMQFHPTILYSPGSGKGSRSFLITEALRGEGATLITKYGHRFAFDDHPDGELAPRDIVARAVHRANTTLGGAFLDCREAIGEHFPHEFPTVFASCMAAGIDPRTTPIPVAPAAHYHMGGIRTDIDGQTSLTNLFAVGECASTGVHGANRLASNSLLEAAAFGERVGRKAAEVTARGGFAPDTDGALRPLPAPRLTPEALKTLRTAMQAHAAVIRDETGLKTLLETITGLEAAFKGALPLVAARLIAQCALQRRESRGSHYRQDYPATATEGQRTFVRLTEGGLIQRQTQKEVA